MVHGKAVNLDDNLSRLVLGATTKPNLSLLAPTKLLFVAFPIPMAFVVVPQYLKADDSTYVLIFEG